MISGTVRVHSMAYSFTKDISYKLIVCLNFQIHVPVEVEAFYANLGAPPVQGYRQHEVSWKQACP